MVLPVHAGGLRLSTRQDGTVPHRGGRGPCRASFGVGLGFAVLALTAPAAAQTIVGQVLDDVHLAPIPGAVVRLLDRDGSERAQAIADSLGRFRLTPPEDGEYIMEAVRLGYVTARTPLLALHRGGTAPLELTMVPRPIGLEGLEVSVEARANELLRQIGLSEATLGRRWIPPQKIESIEMKRDLGSIVEWNQVPGTFVVRDENTTSGSDRMGLCVTMQRTNSAEAVRRCALVVLNGSLISREQAIMIDPESIEAMAILVPREAATLYGSMGGVGAVLIWTKRGG